jgi:hypothetical protein
MEYWPILAAMFALLGAFAVARYNAYRTASAKFRASVLESLSDFYPTFTRWDGASLGTELKGKFPALQAAVSDFKASLPWWRKDDFHKAWVGYCNATGRDCDMNTYLHYFDAFDPLKSTQAEATAGAQDLFHANVKRLLSFAHKT